MGTRRLTESSLSSFLPGKWRPWLLLQAGLPEPWYGRGTLHRRNNAMLGGTHELNGFSPAWTWHKGNSETNDAVHRLAGDRRLAVAAVSAPNGTHQTHVVNLTQAHYIAPGSEGGRVRFDHLQCSGRAALACRHSTFAACCVLTLRYHREGTRGLTTSEIRQSFIDKASTDACRMLQSRW